MSGLELFTCVILTAVLRNLVESLRDRVAAAYDEAAGSGGLGVPNEYFIERLNIFILI